MSDSDLHVPISKRRVMINSLSSGLTRLLTVVVFVWAVKFLMERVPDEQVAVMWVVMGITMLIPVLQGILTSGLGRYVTEACARGDARRVTQICSSMTPLLAVAAIAIVGLGALGAWQLPHLLNVTPTQHSAFRWMLMLVISRMALGLAVGACNTGLFARQQFVLSNLIQVSGSLLRVVLMVVLLLGISADVVWVVVAQVASQTWVLLASTVASMQRIPALRVRPSEFRWHVAREVVGFGGWYSLGHMAAMFRQSLDAPILQRLAGPISVNAFGIGAYIDQQIRSFLIIFNQPLVPVFTAMHVHGQDARLRNAFLRGGRISTWLAMLAGTPLVIFSPDITRWYFGPDFQHLSMASTVLMILPLTYLFGYPPSMMIRIAHATTRLREVVVPMAISQFCNLLGTLLLVGVFHWGAVGCAISTLATSILFNLFFYWPFCLRTLNIEWNRYLRETVFPGVSPFFVAALCGIVVRKIHQPDGLVELALCISVTTIAYLLAILASLQSVEQSELRAFVKRFSIR